MLQPWTKISSHEEIFAERYAWLMGWALRLTGHDQARAEDLVHDVFIHFVISRPDLDAIGQNLEGYLYAMLRNLHVSQVRRAARRRDQTVSISDFSLADYDSLESGLKAIEEIAQARLEEQIREELRRICQYACLRKESSRAGSVLILRFFHGYYPSEIAHLPALDALDQGLDVRRGSHSDMVALIHHSTECQFYSSLTASAKSVKIRSSTSNGFIMKHIILACIFYSNLRKAS